MRRTHHFKFFEDFLEVSITVHLSEIYIRGDVSANRYQSNTCAMKRNKDRCLTQFGLWGLGRFVYWKLQAVVEWRPE